MTKLLLAFLLLTIQFQVDAQRQGIQGQVFWIGGNQMPGPGKSISPQQGIVREIVIFHEVKLQEELKQFLDGLLREYGFNKTVIDDEISLYQLNENISFEDNNEKEILPFIRVKIFSKRYFIEIKNDTQDLFTN